jgi:hypothetical protein
MIPNLRNPVKFFSQRLSFIKITKQIINFEVKEVEETITSFGVKYPMSPDELKIYPEGERNFAWFSIFTPIELKIDDRLIFTGSDTNIYRVRRRENYSEYGYIEYDVMEDYEYGSTRS